MNVPGLKEFIGNYMVASLVIMLVAYCIHEFAMRMRNKTKTRRRQQVICQRHKKVLKPENFISNYKEFIEENTKGMTLFEIKEFTKNVDLEIYRLVMKGVR